jgi:hypothetical protein
VTYHSGEPFRKAFDKAFQKPSVKTMPNQEQEQEQESSSSEQKNSSDIAKSPVPEKRPTPPSQHASRLAQLLKSEILRNKPDYRITPTQVRKWEATADRMLRIDGRASEQIAELICWVQHDEFWMANVLSMDTLRDKFDQLELRAKSKTSPNKPGPTKLPSDYVPASERILQERNARAGVAQ